MSGSNVGSSRYLFGVAKLADVSPRAKSFLEKIKDLGGPLLEPPGPGIVAASSMARLLKRLVLETNPPNPFLLIEPLRSVFHTNVDAPLLPPYLPGPGTSCVEWRNRMAAEPNPSFSVAPWCSTVSKREGIEALLRSLVMALLPLPLELAVLFLLSNEDDDLPRTMVCRPSWCVSGC